MPAIVRIINAETRARAQHWARIAEPGVTITFRQPTRSNDQNAKMWAMIADIRAQKDKHGKDMKADIWKAVFMRACEHEVARPARAEAGQNRSEAPQGHETRC